MINKRQKFLIATLLVRFDNNNQITIISNQIPTENLNITKAKTQI